LLQTMQSIGFRDVSWTPYSFGIAGLYRAVKPPSSQNQGG
jgi:demethylmenaquinone methyltransferase / 2-methoxy-6-polyprenyl-1,4-benzoquinol methylase